MTTPSCPDDSALFALLDEPEAVSPVATHVATCVACQAKKAEIALLIDDLRAPVRAHASDAFVARLTSKLDARPARALAPRRWFARAPFFLAGTALLAAAAIVLLRVDRTDDQHFAARGLSIEAGPSRDVDLGLDIVSRAAGRTTVVPVTEDARTDTTSHLLLSYATRSARATFHLLCFAVDSHSEVHWLYPAFEDVASDPSSIPLPPGATIRPMPAEVMLEGVPGGRLRVFAVVGEHPMRVSDVEKLDATQIDTASLSARFPGADVRSWTLAIDSAGAGEGGAP